MYCWTNKPVTCHPDPTPIDKVWEGKIYARFLQPNSTTTFTYILNNPPFLRKHSRQIAQSNTIVKLWLVQWEALMKGANDRVRIVDRNGPYVCEGLDL